MKCKLCNVEMFVYDVVPQGNDEIFKYSCPNPQCVNHVKTNTPQEQPAPVETPTEPTTAPLEGNA